MRFARTATALTAATFAVTAAALLGAQAPATPNATMTDLSGIWSRLDTGGGGSYGGITEQFPKAQLTPEAAKLVPPPGDQGLNPAATPPPPVIRAANGAILTPDAAAQALAGNAPTQGRCNVGGGGGGVDINSSGMSLMQSKDEVVLVRDGAAGGRHIYTDGRKHPANLTPSGSGHSIGHWENGNLVVHTIGLTPGVLGFGRGYRTPETELTEVYKVSPDGKRMTITYTWNDPKIYVKPHVYDISFERPDSAYVFENWCDASIDHPENYTSIAPPVQIPDKK